MTTDPLELRDQLDVMAQRFERSSRGRHERYSGVDEHRVVRADLDAEGKLVHVQVEPDWRDVIEPSRLGGAVLEAITAAQVERTVEWGRSADEVAAEDLRARPLPVFEADFAEQVTDRLGADASIDGEAAMVALAEALREMRDSLTSARQDLAAVAASELRGLSDNTGKVEVTMRGTGEIANVRFDEHWLERAHPANITRLVLAAVADAQQRLAGRSMTDIAASSRLVELARQLGDPDFVAAQLRR